MIAQELEVGRWALGCGCSWYRFLFICLFTFGCIGSSLLTRLFSSCGNQGATLHCSARASNCSDFSWGAPALGCLASVVTVRGLRTRSSRA